MPTEHVNGIDIYYERSGSGRRLMLLNGSGGTLVSAALLIKFLSRHFDLLAHDQRGLGRTAIPPGPYTMADYAADADALADRVGWDRYSVVGLSFGGMVAQELAVTVPEKIERLALMCTSSGGAGGSSFPLHTLLAMAAKDQVTTRIRIMDTRFDDEWLAAHEADRALVSTMTRARDDDKSAEVVRGETLQLQARIGHDVYDRLGRITCPTLVAAGRFDGIAPPSNAEAIASRIADSQLRLYEGGHIFMAQDSSALPELVQFLQA